MADNNKPLIQTEKQKFKRPKHGTVFKNDEKSKKFLIKMNNNDFENQENNLDGSNSYVEKAFITTSIRSSITSKSLKITKDDVDFNPNANLFDIFRLFFKDLWNKITVSIVNLRLIFYIMVQVILQTFNNNKNI